MKKFFFQIIVLAAYIMLISGNVIYAAAPESTINPTVTPTPTVVPETPENTPTPTVVPEIPENTPTPTVVPETPENTPTPTVVPETPENTPTPTNLPEIPEKFYISDEQKIISLKEGETYQLQVIAIPNVGKIYDVSYRTDSIRVAVVEEDGLIIAVGPGMAVITASCGGKEAECIVRVEKVVATPTPKPAWNSISLNFVGEMTVAPGVKQKKILFAGESISMNFAAGISANDIVVDGPAARYKDNVITVLKKGTVKISSTIMGKKKKLITIKVRQIISPLQVRLKVGKSKKVKLKNAAVYEAETEWFSSNPAVAVVNGGVVTGISPGTAELCATLRGHKCTTTVLVK